MSLWYLRREGKPRRKLVAAETAEEAVIACGDEEDVILAGHEVWAALFELDREPGDFEAVDEESGEIVLVNAAGANAYFGAVVDQGAGWFRTLFITDVPGQEMTYVRKEKEGRSFLAGEPGPWPMLAAEAGTTGQEIAALAATVVAQADQIIALGALIEGARMGAKKAVREALTEADKCAAAEVDWMALLPPRQAEGAIVGE